MPAIKKKTEFFGFVKKKNGNPFKNGKVASLMVYWNIIETLRFLCLKHQPRRNLRSYLVMQRLSNEAALSLSFWY